MSNLTSGQIITLVIAAVIILVVISTVKSMIKFGIVVAVLVVALVSFGVLSPDKLGDIKTKVMDNAEVLQSIEGITDSFDLNNGDPKIKVANEWIYLKDVSSFASEGKDKAELVVNGVKMVVEDSDIVKVLEMFKK